MCPAVAGVCKSVQESTVLQQLEEKGVVGPADNNGFRKVLFAPIKGTWVLDGYSERAQGEAESEIVQSSL